MKKHKVIGLMSGTSLDGLDLAYCHIWNTKTEWKFDIIQTKSVSYNTKMQQQLQRSIYLTAEELLTLNSSYGTWLGQQAHIFIQEHQLEVDFIASHGHTTHHKPEKGFTYQIGSGHYLANESGCMVICDFRSNDVALGGQGAPLVPMGDQLFFGDYDFCLNLGGISNVSFEQNNQRLAYDIGLANMILNHITQKINLAYDKDGALASTGIINKTMLNEMNALEFYGLDFPKSTGYEWFVEQVVPIVEKTKDSVENLLHTAVHHICEQIAIQLIKNSAHDHFSVFITGGGALNHFLITVLQEKLGPKVRVEIPSKTLIEFKEALVFGLMGVLRSEKEINVLASVTGAQKDSSSGLIFLPS